MLTIGTAEELTRRLSALLDQRGGPPDAAADLQAVLAALSQQAESLQAEAHRLPVWQIAGGFCRKLCKGAAKHSRPRVLMRCSNPCRDAC